MLVLRGMMSVMLYRQRRSATSQVWRIWGDMDGGNEGEVEASRETTDVHP